MHTNLPKAIVFASSEHHFLQCTQFKELEISKRFDLVKRLNLCLNCLSNSHSQSNCHSKYRCRKCSKRHHTLLHFDPAAVSQLSTASQSESNLSPNAPGFSPNTVVRTHLQNTMSDQIILATTVVSVRDAFGNLKLGRA